MLRYFGSTIILVLFLTNAFSTPLDSLGVEKRNGKILIQHKVEKGETLFSILQRYECSEKDFFTANNTLKIGATIMPEQVIEVPYKVKRNKNKPPIVAIITEPSDKKNLDENGIEVVDIPEATPKDAPKMEQANNIDSSKGGLPKVDITKKIPPAKVLPKAKTHVVVAGQNLFTVAKLYNLKVWQLRDWNKLANDALRVNQVLVIEKPANFVAKVAKKDTLKVKSAQIQAPSGDVTKGKIKDEVALNKPTTNKPATNIPNAPGGKKFAEQGIAEIIGAGEGTNKFLALHRTAPVGTLIKVANQANGQSVWVKVIGKLSGSGDVVIKISPKAFEKLSPKDKRIRAELSYSLSN